MESIVRTKQEIAALIPRLRKFARVLTGNMVDADDVVQASLEKAMRNIDQYQPGTRLDSWLFAIARNQWIDDRRLARNRNPHDDVDDMVDLTGDDGREETETRDMQRRVRAAVNTLPHEQRELVGLVMLEGFAYREAAAMLDIPIGTVMSRLSRAKAALASELAAVGGI
ncbi:MAG: RNA polymerase sigma factor [Sphingopyxis sp.]|nr:RNA polymerase sigma factor [Sphingopyxis sp.]